MRQIDAGSVQPFGGGKPMNDPGLLHLPEGDQWGCRVDQDKEGDGIVHA